MKRRIWAVGIVMAIVAAQAHAAPLSGQALVSALRGGGYVIVMRHASSPTALPDAATADPGNPRHERQLDSAGRAAATAMGQALKRLKIPVASVRTSPTYRARETVRLLGVGAGTPVPELGDGGVSMSATAAGPAAWLRTAAATAPPAGKDALLVTHQPNMAAAFAGEAAGLTDGEALVFHPDGKGGTELVARVKMGDWPALAGR
jgi:phosphohistidine phosphatase SixA